MTTIQRPRGIVHTIIINTLRRSARQMVITGILHRIVAFVILTPMVSYKIMKIAR